MKKLEKLKKFIFIDSNLFENKIEMLINKKITHIFAFMVFLNDENNQKMINKTNDLFSHLVIERKNNIILENKKEFD